MVSDKQIKKNASESVSRIPCSPEGIYSEQSEKELHRSGDKHATSKASGLQSDKIHSVSFSIRQEKTVHTEVACEKGVQRPSREKVESREKNGVLRSAGKQGLQKVDVQSDETPIRFLFQKLKKSKKKGTKQKLLSAQQIDREGTDFGDQGNGPGLVGPMMAGPPHSVEENVPTQGPLAQTSPQASAQVELQTRDIKSRSQQRTQTGFFTLPRNRKKLPILLGGRRMQSGKCKKRRFQESSGSRPSLSQPIDNNIDGTSIAFVFVLLNQVGASSGELYIGGSFFWVLVLGCLRDGVQAAATFAFFLLFAFGSSIIGFWFEQSMDHGACNELIPLSDLNNPMSGLRQDDRVIVKVTITKMFALGKEVHAPNRVILEAPKKFYDLSRDSLSARIKQLEQELDSFKKETRENMEDLKEGLNEKLDQIIEVLRNSSSSRNKRQKAEITTGETREALNQKLDRILEVLRYGSSIHYQSPVGESTNPNFHKAEEVPALNGGGASISIDQSPASLVPSIHFDNPLAKVATTPDVHEIEESSRAKDPVVHGGSTSFIEDTPASSVPNSHTTLNFNKANDKDEAEDEVENEAEDEIEEILAMHGGSASMSKEEYPASLVPSSNFENPIAEVTTSHDVHNVEESSGAEDPVVHGGSTSFMEDTPASSVLSSHTALNFNKAEDEAEDEVEEETEDEAEDEIKDIPAMHGGSASISEKEFPVSFVPSINFESPTAEVTTTHDVLNIEDDERRMMKSSIQNQGIARDPLSSQPKACTGERQDMGSGPTENGLWTTLPSSGLKGSSPRTSSCLEVVPDSLENSNQHRPTLNGPGISNCYRQGEKLKKSIPASLPLPVVLSLSQS
ncbi:hypothetical protein Ancab_028444 [Ancistrocladus abbreviatus]